MGTIKALSCAWMAGKKEFSAVVVKCVQEFFPDISECLTASPDRAVGSWSWNGTSMLRGLISERSYPSAVEPAALNGSIRERVVCCWILAIYADEPQISRPTRCRA
jgi:hypothetical protein